MVTRIIEFLLFHHLPAWERRRRANTTLLVLMTTLTFGAIIGAIMYWINSKRY